MCTLDLLNRSLHSSSRHPHPCLLQVILKAKRLKSLSRPWRWTRQAPRKQNYQRLVGGKGLSGFLICREGPLPFIVLCCTVCVFGNRTHLSEVSVLPLSQGDTNSVKAERTRKSLHVCFSACPAPPLTKLVIASSVRSGLCGLVPNSDAITYTCTIRLFFSCV